MKKALYLLAKFANRLKKTIKKFTMKNSPLISIKKLDYLTLRDFVIIN